MKLSDKLLRKLKDIEKDCFVLEIQGCLTEYGMGQRDIVKMILEELD